MKTLIIGGSGFLGSKLAETLDGTCQSTYYSNPTFSEQVNLNLGDRDSIRKCLAETKPEIILHCGGLTNTDFCEANPDLVDRINCFGTSELINGFDGKIIYFSTDYVFDGESAPYNEEAETNPINNYGKTKLLAERKVLEKPQNLVVRVSGLYGFNRYNNKFLDGIRKSKVVKASHELISTPTYIQDIARAVSDFMQMSGVLHFSGEQPFSRYEFVKRVVEGLGLNIEVIVQETNGIARRPKNSSLLSVYNLKKTPVDEALKEIRREIWKEQKNFRKYVN